MQTKLSVIAVVAVALLIGGVLLLGGNNNAGGAIGAGVAGTPSAPVASVGTAVVEDGVQYVDITARGGYTPEVTKAQAGVPTVIRMKTENSYDCSTALVIPDIGFQKFLSPTGVEEIDIPLENTEGVLKGMCSMAMYHFSVEFE